MHQIEIFLTVARYQNISRAAQELYISQPAISNWISKMEGACGIPLFKRTNRGVKLTPEGEILYARLDIAYHRFRVSVSEICQPTVDPSHTLRFGCLHRRDISELSVGALHLFGEQNPGISTLSEMYNFHELREKLLCDELDIALSVSYDIGAYAEFDYVRLCPFTSYFAVSKDWHTAIENGPGLHYLHQRPLILEARTESAPALAVCAANGFEPSDVCFVSSYILLSTLVARGAGFSISGDMAEEDYNYPRAEHIPIPQGSEAHIVAAWRRGRLTPLAEDFLTTLQTYVFQ